METGRFSRWITIAGALFCLAGSASGAAFQLGISSTPAVATTNRTLAYTLALTNRTSVGQSNLIVSSSFNARISFLSANNSSGTAGVEGGAIIYRTPFLGPGSNLTLTLNLRPIDPGFLTNTLQMRSDQSATEVTNNVRRVFVAEADLGVQLRSPTNPVVAGDWINYRLVVTNAGPELVPQFTVTNLFPGNARFISLTPSNPPVSLTATQLVVQGSSLAVGQTRQFNVVIQPNTAASTQITARVAGPDLSDPVSGNDAVTNSLQVVTPTAGVLSAAFVSAATFNPQTGLMEQTIRITNLDDASIPMSRVVLSGLGHPVVNATGTNAGLPFIVLPRALAPGESAELTIEYFSPTRTATGNPVLSAFQVPQDIPRAPTGQTVAISRIQRLPDGRFLLEFPSAPGAAYTILYNDQVPLTNALQSLPSITAPADRTQWIDGGPPRTSHRPGEVPARFYRVIRAQ
ncbi:MAG TPA: hypothetical protein DCY13_03175 [Verrucomicrobiales bacterium]|nr:hypothetical protein [Verrucomicrobiales bacterium]